MDNDGLDRARKLIHENMESNPQFKAGLERAQARLRDFGEKHGEEIAARIRDHHEQLLILGFRDMGEWLETLLHVCRVIERDPAGLTLDQIELEAIAWIDRAKMLQGIHENPLPRADAALVEPVAEMHEDGPDKSLPGIFYWANRRHHIGKRNWQLCCAIWQNAGISFCDAGYAVWGEDTQSSTIKSQLSRLNTKMADLGIPLAWVNQSERIYLDDGGDPVAN